MQADRQPPKSVPKLAKPIGQQGEEKRKIDEQNRSQPDHSLGATGGDRTAKEPF